MMYALKTDKAVSVLYQRKSEADKWVEFLKLKGHNVKVVVKQPEEWNVPA